MSAVSKRDAAPPPAVQVVSQRKGPAFPPGRMLISSPLEIQELVHSIPKGRVLTLGTLRSRLAADHRADYTCPLTTGIFLRIVAEADLEEKGRQRRTPVWRVVRDDASLLDKLPGGATAQADLLEDEGVEILRLGKSLRVARLEHRQWQPPPRRRKGSKP